MIEERSATVGQSEDSSLESIGGWLIIPVLNLLLTIIICIFVVVKTLLNGDTLFALVPVYAIAACLYSVACLGVLFERMRIAKYLLLAFYAFALFSNLVATFFLHAPAHRVGISGIAPYIRGILEVTMILYFAFSVRVRRTLVN